MSVCERREVRIRSGMVVVGWDRDGEEEDMLAGWEGNEMGILNYVMCDVM